MTAPDPTQYIWWLASRASGIVALGLITTSVLMGLAMAGRLTRAAERRRALLRLHEHVALAGLVAIAVHGITLLGDRWLHPGVGGIVVPFAMGYRPIFTGLGILGGYLAAALGLSFYLRRRIGARLWRRLHRLTIVAYALGLVHAIGSGTDASVPWVRTAMLMSAVPVGTLLVLRMRPRRKPAPRAQGRPRAAAGSLRALGEEAAG